MKKKIKIYHVSNCNHYSNWIPDVESVNDLENADLVLFPGGVDVCPTVYNQKQHPKTFTNFSRDQYEISVYKAALKSKKHMLGICRGNQILCALQPNGLLIQHQDNPGTHFMKTYDGTKLVITSTHHQAAYPFNMDQKNYKVLGWTEGISKYHEGGNQEELNPPKECEIVYYPKTKCLGIQGHPEMMPKDHETNDWLRELLNKFLTDSL